MCNRYRSIIALAGTALLACPFSPSPSPGAAAPLGPVAVLTCPKEHLRANAELILESFTLSRADDRLEGKDLPLRAARDPRAGPRWLEPRLKVAEDRAGGRLLVRFEGGSPAERRLVLDALVQAHGQAGRFYAETGARILKNPDLLPHREEAERVARLGEAARTAKWSVRP